MSGSQRMAKPAVGCPLDGGVRRLCLHGRWRLLGERDYGADDGGKTHCYCDRERSPRCKTKGPLNFKHLRFGFSLHDVVVLAEQALCLMLCCVKAVFILEASLGVTVASARLKERFCKC